MNAEFIAGIAAGVILRDLWCWIYAKVRSRFLRRREELARMAADAKAKQERADALVKASQERTAARHAAEERRIAMAKTDLNAIPFVVEVRNDDDFLLAVRKVHRSLRAAD